MTTRFPLCTLTLIAGTMLSACASQPDQQPTEITSTGFGMHIASHDPREGLTASWERDGEGFQPTVYFNPTPFITAEHVAAFTDTRDANGNPALSIRMTEDGSDRMLATTSQRVGQPIVLTIDGRVISAPHVMSAIRRHAIVTGDGGDTWWMEGVKAAFTEAGAEKADGSPQPDPGLPPEALGIGIFVASTQRSDFFFIELPPSDGPTLYASDRPLLVIDHFASAASTTDETGNPAIRLELNQAGRAIMQDSAGVYIGNYLVPCWQGHPISALRIMRKPDGTILVSDMGIDPELPENWMAELGASLPD